MKVLCIGAILCDVAFNPVEKADGLRGGSVVCKNFSIHGGGEGNNASLDFAALGEEVRLVGRVGADFIGDHLLSELNRNGVNTDHVIRVDDAPTTISVQMISGIGARTLAAKRWGANETLAKDDVPDELIEWADHIHVVAAMCLSGFDGEGSARVFEKAHKLGKTTSMDLNNPRFDGPCFHLYEDALYNCDVFLPSSYELERSVGLTDMTEIRRFFSKYDIGILGVKRSELGSYVTDFKEEIYMPSLLEGNPVDVVGAGDAFSSTFVSAYKRGYSMHDCCAIASSASAHVLSRLGSTAGMRDFETLKAYAAARGALKQL